MRRRDLIALVTGAITFRPLAARAQPAKRRRIAIVTSVIPAYLISEESGDNASRLLFRELRRLGHVDGGDMIVERYSAEGHPERLAALAREVVSHAPELIVAGGGPVAEALAGATTTIPIVAIFTSALRTGLVASLARPGSNITGVSVDIGMEIVGKRIQMLKEVAPAARKVGYIEVSGSSATTAGPVLADASQKLGISIVVIPLRESTREEYERIFAEMAERKIDAVLISDQGEALAYRQLIVELAQKNHLPTMCASADFVDIGGLMSYAADPEAVFRAIADDVHQILAGTKPERIPVVQPTKFEFSVNLNTVQALGLIVPPPLLAAADRVID
jgi:putative ABC transport system substrate-binding protein